VSTLSYNIATHRYCSVYNIKYKLLLALLGLLLARYVPNVAKEEYMRSV